VTGSGASGQVSFWFGSSQVQSGDNLLYWDNTNKRLGIGTQTPLSRLHIAVGDLLINQEVAKISMGLQGSSGDSHFGSSGIGGPITGTQDYGFYTAHNAFRNSTGAWKHSRQTSIGAVRFLGAGGGAGGASGFLWDYSANVGAADITWTNLMALTLTGRLGIGIASPAARLHVVGSGSTSTTWTAQFHNSAGNNNALMIRDDGNVGIGTYSPGAKLQVNGSTSDNTATALRASNSSNQNLFDVRNDGQLGIGTLNFWYSYNDATGVATRVATGGLMRISYGAIGATGSGYGLFVANGQITNRDYTSGDGGGFRLGEGYAPTSGTGTYNSFLIGGTINQTGGANGITRGILISPTLTSAADYRAIQFNNNSGWGIYGADTAKSYFAGNVAIGTTSQNASSAFEVASTTQGILFPRMTTAQRNAITTPADGLVIYNTTDNKLQVRAAGAWVDLH
jgi:hypothetical protein